MTASPARSLKRLLLAKAGLLSALLLASAGCSTHHWAQVKSSQLPPPFGPKIVHTGALLVEVVKTTDETQCLTYERYRPVCFYNIRPAVEQGLVRSLWPAYPDVRVGRLKYAAPGEYVLQVDLSLDALPPDRSGPGWSAGVQGRYRLLRDGKVLSDSTLSSRSRSDFPYGSPLGAGATEVMNAALLHIAGEISMLPETKPDVPVPLPRVASRVASPAVSPASATVSAGSAKQPAYDASLKSAQTKPASANAKSATGR